MRRDEELTEFMVALFRAYRVKGVVKIKITNYKYDGCTVIMYMESGRNVGCRLKYHTDNDVMSWIKERYDIVDAQWYGYDPETLVTIMRVQKKNVRSRKSKAVSR